ncbi:MAG: putative deoxyribose-specific transporter, ATP-binding protein [Evtepia sp.]|nr:putative deoxyribose-specific transporter, ATP-binding protein [Evtepia sp.]
MQQDYAVEMRGVTKNFGEVCANHEVNLTIHRGEILALLGENGSGKTTLMNMLSGIYFPDAGQIMVGGQEAAIRSPKDAFRLKIGMVHQHFKLVDVFSAAENILLGLDESGRYDKKKATEEIRALAARYGFELDPERLIFDMAVSEKQTVEIIKVLYRGADILILDEPTAVLTPQETEKLFSILRNMREDGKSIVIITHKLGEVMAISDRVTVLRKGEYVDTLSTKETNPQALADMMVGRAITLNIERPEPKNPQTRLEVSGLTCRNQEGVRVLDHVSFEARSGEILGIAGIAGSGQRELCEAIAGLYPVEQGSIGYYSAEDPENREELVGRSPTAIRDLGVSLAFVPEDRLGMGLVGSMGMIGNMMLKSYNQGKSFLTDSKPSKDLAEDVRNRLGVVTPDLTTPVQRLSGGNVQKVLLGREIASSPSVLMAAYPVRGLDIHSSYMIYSLLNDQKETGVAVLYVGEDLDVLLELCDRILVLCGGKVSGIVDGRSATKEEVGLMMTQIKEVGQHD